MPSVERPSIPFARVLALPPAVKAGDLVAVVSPAGPVDQEKLERGVRRLEEMGLAVRVGTHALDHAGYMAGPDAARLADLQAAISDTDVRAVLFSRGGYGIMRIVDRLDLSPLARHPKLVMGFSDVTALELAIASRVDLATIYGPMVASNLGKELPNERTMLGFRHAMGMGALPAIDESFGIRMLGPAARVTAPLSGGCLSIIVATLGTPFEIATRGGIFFWEDVSEDLYRLDRMLTQLRLAGKIEDLAAMVVGVPVGITREKREGNVGDLTDFVATWLETSLGGIPFPVVTQFPCSHTEPCIALPLGRLVTVDTASGSVEIAHR